MQAERSIIQQAQVTAANDAVAAVLGNVNLVPALPTSTSPTLALVAGRLATHELALRKAQLLVQGLQAATSGTPASLSAAVQDFVERFKTQVCHI